MHPDLRPSHRLEWWIRLPGDRIEWSGRWYDFTNGKLTRTTALTRRGKELGGGMVLITKLDGDGDQADQVAATLDEVDRWDPASQPLPDAVADPGSLPPDGWDDIERRTMLGCNEALSRAIASDTLTAEQVRTIINIVHDAFSGVGQAWASVQDRWEGRKSGKTLLPSGNAGDEHAGNERNDRGTRRIAGAVRPDSRNRVAPCAPD